MYKHEEKILKKSGVVWREGSIIVCPSFMLLALVSEVTMDYGLTLMSLLW